MRKSELKQQRQITILHGMVELFLASGKPVGSATLQESGFDHISSATIRNYFSKLEQAGLVRQQHSSGGRIPTKQGLESYIESILDHTSVASSDSALLNEALEKDTKEIVSQLQTAAEVLSEVTGQALLISSPRFDQDLVTQIKLALIDETRVLCIMVTDFGLIHTELLYLPHKLSSFAIKRLENFFQSKLTNTSYPKMSQEEEQLANKLYDEIVLRHIIKYSQFTSEDIYTTGLSKLIEAQKQADSAQLALSLTLLENSNLVKKMLDQSMHKGELDCFIGIERFIKGNTSHDHTSIITAPYFINGKPVGAIAIFGALRTDYKRIFGILKYFSTLLSHSLSRNLYRHNITFREPQAMQIDDLSHHTKSLPSKTS